MDSPIPLQQANRPTQLPGEKSRAAPVDSLPMASEPIITVSGLRGIVGESLTADVASRYAAAFAGTLKPGVFVITNDARKSAAELEAVISQTLAKLGFDVLVAGSAATPTLGVLVKQHRAVGGIQISASHNPAEYNGMKLFSSAGRVLPADAGATVLHRYRELSDVAESAHADNGSVQRLEDALSAHCEVVVQSVDADAIRRKKFRVLLDSNHGGGGPLGVRLLQELGCDVVEFGTQPDAQYEHPLEPTEENLQSVMALAREHNCDVTFCQDPDADRLAVIDEHGQYLGEELTLALCVEQRLRQKVGPVVVNCSSSRVTEDIANKHGAAYFRTKVGEANVVDQMLAVDAVIGGEGNGGVIDPRIVFVRDSFIGIAMILEAMATRDQSVSALAAELPKYEIVKTKVAMSTEQLPGALSRLKNHFAEATTSELDGLRLDWSDKWLLVRTSNTEPIVRIIAEATTRDDASALCQSAANVLSSGG